MTVQSMCRTVIFNLSSGIDISMVSRSIFGVVIRNVNLAVVGVPVRTSFSYSGTIL